MNALQPLEPLETRRSQRTRQPQQPHPVRRSRPISRRHNARARGLMTETGVKLLVHGVLSVATIATLVKLLPYSLTQQGKLTATRQEVKEAEKRVNPLRDEFNSIFSSNDPRRIMEEQSPLVDPNRLQVVFHDQSME